MMMAIRRATRDLPTMHVGDTWIYMSTWASFLDTSGEGTVGLVWMSLLETAVGGKEILSTVMVTWEPATYLVPSRSSRLRSPAPGQSAMCPR